MNRVPIFPEVPMVQQLVDTSTQRIFDILKIRNDLYPIKTGLSPLYEYDSCTLFVSDDEPCVYWVHVKGVGNVQTDENGSVHIVPNVPPHVR